MAVMPSDAELVLAARGGDAGAFGTLLERHRAPLYASALAVLGERAAAQDVVQDAFLIALRRLGDLREPSAVAGWLHAIVRNATRMRVRRASHELASEAPPARGDVIDAEAALERLALRDWVWTALERLPEDLGVTVMLRYFSRHSSYREIAATLGVPVGTVRSRLNQARAKLADALLATAATGHVDHARLVERRKEEWRTIIEEVVATGRAELYAADCASDVLVEAPSLAYREHGVDDHRGGVEESAAAGVRLHLTGLVASPGVTIVEGDYENPPHDPHHCPATHTEVRIHPDGRTARLLLYYTDTGRRDTAAELAGA
jgi:RNA polymerase sigma factor (sigma-70 family)